MKKILGLDLGTNSIGWAVVNAQEDNNGKLEMSKIEAAGSRIIPMDASILGDFDKGNVKSQTAERTAFRGIRRLHERYILRRERLNRVLSVMGFLPIHYKDNLDQYGKFLNNSEPKLAWNLNENKEYEFLFQKSFNEMLDEFKNHHTTLTSSNKIPYDWTLYYLRKKALVSEISKEELAWVLLNFNHKRGYNQLRGEEEDDKKDQLVEFYALKVIEVEDSGEKKGKDIWYNIKLENGWIYRRTSKEKLDWEGKIKEFIVTTALDENGYPKKDKEGNIKRSFRAPKEDDWTLVKKKTENDIDKTGKTIGEYIYDTILENPSQKINGKLVSTIERKYYVTELTKILEKQKEFHNELNDSKLLNDCLQELYSNNDAHTNSRMAKGFVDFLINDVIFYQRPLKVKKSLISDCPYEERVYIDNVTKERKSVSIKCVSKSHPLFQEFRLWHFISNIRIYEKEKVIDGKLVFDVDVTNYFLNNEEAYVKLFKWLNNKKEINQKAFLSYPEFGLKKTAVKYRWNYVEDDAKLYPCNKTRGAILAKLTKDEASSLSKDLEVKIWHLLYSINSQDEINRVFKDKGQEKGIYRELQQVFSEESIQKIKNIKFLETDYAAYSLKAINRLLPLMRMGELWSEKDIDIKTLDRISKILSGEYESAIGERVREKAINLKDLTDFKGLPLWLVCYIVYDRHSESKEILKWETPDDLEVYIRSFKQHSLRNPIVEQVILETLRVVRDIWKQIGQIDEIHLELGREMKNPADKRAQITKQNIQNENTNLRIKALLTEFIKPEYNVENVIPYSPSQQELLRIYEDGVFDGVTDIPEDIEVILKKFNESDNSKRPSNSDVLKYKLWLEQKYVSPYTGSIISLSRLFTRDYEIEHIIPQSRYFDDSFSNKVICEAEVNRLKSNELAYEFIKNHENEKVEIGLGKTVNVLSVNAYEELIKNKFSKNKSKLNKLLMDDIPDAFIERQLNDSRYISKVIKSLLSNVVRAKDINGDYEQEAVSKNLLSCTGGITDRLKREWGMNDAWNAIILPRFKRLNDLTGSNLYTALNKEGHCIPSMPLEKQKGFNKKRIDHRHHAMDAIVIACTTRNHINLLNNESAKSSNKSTRYQLSKLLRRYERIEIIKDGEKKVIDAAKEFIKPWDNFTQDSKEALEKIIVSFKKNLRIINKSTNYYQKVENGKKIFVKQEGCNIAIRKPMHKDTVSGKVNLQLIKQVSLSEAIKQPNRIVDKELKSMIKSLVLKSLDSKRIKKYFEENRDIWQEINLSKIDVYYYSDESNEKYFASRKLVDTSFNEKKIKSNVTDTGAQKILLAHLEANDNKTEKAFSPDGIDAMNTNIKTLNSGKDHKPIIKVRVYEKADKFAIGQNNSKSSKFVEAAKGTNLFYAVYEKQVYDAKNDYTKIVREYETVPLNVVIDRKKKGEPIATSDENRKLLFVISPNDLVYLPTKEEIVNGEISMPICRDRIYKFVSCTGSRSYFIKYYIANSIVDKFEFESLNKMERATTGEMLKETCIPLKIDRLGNIINM